MDHTRMLSLTKLKSAVFDTAKQHNIDWITEYTANNIGKY